MDILELLIFSLALNTLLFLFAYLKKTDKLTDMAYALSFIGIVLFGYFSSNQTIGQSIVAILVLLWAVRLGGYLVIRIHTIGRDKRFDGMREKFWSFGRFWLLQGVTAWVVMLGATLYFAGPGPIQIPRLFWLGVVVSLAGLAIEAIADWQKFQFMKSGSKSFIKSGLWRYSRHPNYFGEILMWLGVFMACAQALSGTDILIALISPLFITTLLLFVSGIPLLEKSADKKFADNKAYQAYKARTSVLIPFPPKNER